MNLEELRKFKPQIEEFADKYGVKNIRVFGSVVNGDANDESDVDFLIEMEDGRSGFDMGGFYENTKNLINKEIDVVTANMIHKNIRREILKRAEPL